MCWADEDAELDMLAKLVEQQDDDEQSHVTDTSVADAGCGHRVTTMSSTSNIGSCETMANTELAVNETDEQRQYLFHA